MELKHKGTVRLETGRLVLRRFVPEDQADIYENCWRDYAVWRWTSYDPMPTICEVQTAAGLFTSRWFAAYERPDRYNWAIQLKGGPVIGRISGLNPDSRVSQVELAYELGRAWWNQGYATEAARAVIRFFFAEVGFNRIFAYHAPENPASGRVMEKCGMRLEGRLRQAYRCNGGLYDMVVYGILAEDWRGEAGKAKKNVSRGTKRGT